MLAEANAEHVAELCDKAVLEAEAWKVQAEVCPITSDTLLPVISSFDFAKVQSFQISHHDCFLPAPCIFTLQLANSTH